MNLVLLVGVHGMLKLYVISFGILALIAKYLISNNDLLYNYA